MRIESIDIKNFKRFTDLSIKGIPSDTKLVLLIGENGSGKSSIFDAFHCISTSSSLKTEKNREDFLNYYKKDATLDFNIHIQLQDSKEIELEDGYTFKKGIELANQFYGRSSLRIVPRITNIEFNNQIIDQDIDRPRAYIDKDTRFLADVIKYTQDINKALREPFFSGQIVDASKIAQKYIEPFNQSLENIFGQAGETAIKLVQFEDASPSKPPRLIFQKGRFAINYDLLSHGEKQVVILLLNFIVRKERFDDIIFFIDEMDAHMNTALQYNLIKEITENWIPENCQLWTASHSLGFIEYAQQYERGQIIDFDHLDYDQEQVLYPSNKENLEVYEIAVPKELILKIFKDKKVILCERNDSEYYNLALGDNKTIFIPARDSKEVFLTTKSQSSYTGLRDRDFLTDKEVQQLTRNFPNLKILDLYSIENYMYHPDNIETLGKKGFDKLVYIEDIKKQKKEKSYEIIEKIAVARQHYEEFKIDIKKNKDKRNKDVSDIRKDLTSDDFDRFYKFFSMKKYFAANYLEAFNISKKELVTTKWFQKQISNIINK